MTFLGFGTGTLFHILSCILEDFSVLLAASPASASAIISYSVPPNLTFLGTRWTSKCIHLCCNLYRLQAGADSTMDTS